MQPIILKIITKICLIIGEEMVATEQQTKSIYEPWHGISNNMVCATSKALDQPARTHSLIRAFASRCVKLLTEHHLECLSLKGGCTGSPESTLVKMPHCWKSHVAAQLCFCIFQASEKSLKAAGFARDANTVEKNSHDIMSLSSGFPSIRDHAVELANLVGVHTKMRYFLAHILLDFSLTVKGATLIFWA